MIFVLLNSFIVTSIYLFLKRTCINSFSELVLSVFTLYCAQIITTQTLLGSVGFLTVTKLSIINFAVSGLLLYLALKSDQEFLISIKNDLIRIKSSMTDVYKPYNIFLSLLLILLSIWIILASYLLPARAIDDITYHLTTIIEFIKNEKIFLLPVDYRPHVTLPLNGELLFMWPAIFYRNSISFGLIQYIAGLAGMVTTYRLCRLFNLERHISLFAGLLFIFAPVVMAQSGSAYIDLILSVFFLIALYFSVKYYLNKADVYLFLAASSIGMMVGMKYTALILALSLQVFILNRELIRDKFKLLIYCIISFICGGFWYLRNLLEFGSFFPFLDSILRSNDTNNYAGEGIHYHISVLFQKANQLFMHDIGLGSLHGGFGIVFWGIAFPCLVYYLIKSFKLPDRNRLFPLYVWLQVFAGMFFLIISPLDRLYYRPRYSIFIIALGMIALGKIIQKFDRHSLYKMTIIYSCCVFSLFSLIQLSITTVPSYRIDFTIRNILKSDTTYSKMKYLILDGTSMREIWETLDFISRDYNSGLSTYFAMTNKDFATPFYGSNLQNRIWNFAPETNNPPDTYVFHFEDNAPVKYLGRKITIDQVLRNPDYQLIDMVDKSYLFLNKEFIYKDNVVSKSLMKHYENYYSEDIGIVKRVLGELDSSIPIVTSSYLGFVFNYLKVMKIISNEVYITPVNYENSIIKYYGIDKFYTIGFIPEWSRTKIIGTIRIDNKEIKIYENSLESN